jgi:hypothetical protein
VKQHVGQQTDRLGDFGTKHEQRTNTGNPFRDSNVGTAGLYRPVHETRNNREILGPCD